MANHQEAGGFSQEHVQPIADYILSKTVHRPTIAIICGSGLGGIPDHCTEIDSFDYHTIPGFPVSTVHGHAGRLIIGKLGAKTVVCMQGRFHPYEGYPDWKITLPVRVMRRLGATSLIVTNACGGLNETYKVGDLMIIKDHINHVNLAGRNPLVGKNDESFGPRFPPMNMAYCREYRKLARDTANDLGLSGIMREGVYSQVGGPSFETPAEAKFLRIIGSDVVGMSTCSEVIVAIHCGFKVLGISLVTNNVVQDIESTEQANHEEVLETGKVFVRVRMCVYRWFVYVLTQIAG